MTLSLYTYFGSPNSLSLNKLKLFSFGGTTDFLRSDKIRDSGKETGPKQEFICLSVVI